MLEGNNSVASSGCDSDVRSAADVEPRIGVEAVAAAAARGKDMSIADDDEEGSGALGLASRSDTKLLSVEFLATGLVAIGAGIGATTVLLTWFGWICEWFMITWVLKKLNLNFSKPNRKFMMRLFRWR